MRTRTMLSGLFLAGLVVSGAVQAAPAYSILDLGIFGAPNGINDSGQVVGWVYGAPATSSEQHAYLYSNGTTSDLGTLGNQSNATGINQSGQVVGRTSAAGGTSHAFLFSNGIVTNLDGLGSGYSVAQAINGSGQIVGWKDSSIVVNGVPTSAFSYSNGIVTDLGNLNRAFSVNDGGQVVGIVGENSNSRAVLYSNGTTTFLNPLGAFHSVANDINIGGQIVGSADVNTFSGWTSHAFLYSNGISTDLGATLGYQSEARAINDNGQVVGMYYSPQSRAFLYSNGTVTDLNNLIDPLSGWTIVDAADINNAGQIAAYAYDSFGNYETVLLSPIPEPETFALILMAIGILGISLRMGKMNDTQCH